MRKWPIGFGAVLVVMLGLSACDDNAAEEAAPEPPKPVINLAPASPKSLYVLTNTGQLYSAQLTNDQMPDGLEPPVPVEQRNSAVNSTAESPAPPAATANGRQMMGGMGEATGINAGLLGGKMSAADVANPQAAAQTEKLSVAALPPGTKDGEAPVEPLTVASRTVIGKYRTELPFALRHNLAVLESHPVLGDHGILGATQFGELLLARGKGSGYGTGAVSGGSEAAGSADHVLWLRPKEEIAKAVTILRHRPSSKNRVAYDQANDQVVFLTQREGTWYLVRRNFAGEEKELAIGSKAQVEILGLLRGYLLLGNSGAQLSLVKLADGAMQGIDLGCTGSSHPQSDPALHRRPDGTVWVTYEDCQRRLSARAVDGGKTVQLAAPKLEGDGASLDVEQAVQGFLPSGELAFRQLILDPVAKAEGQPEVRRHLVLSLHDLAAETARVVRDVDLPIGVDPKADGKIVTIYSDLVARVGDRVLVRGMDCLLSDAVTVESAKGAGFGDDDENYGYGGAITQNKMGVSCEALKGSTAASFLAWVGTDGGVTSVVRSAWRLQPLYYFMEADLIAVQEVADHPRVRLLRGANGEEVAAFDRTVAWVAAKHETISGYGAAASYGYGSSSLLPKLALLSQDEWPHLVLQTQSERPNESTLSLLGAGDLYGTAVKPVSLGTVTGYVSRILVADWNGKERAAAAAADTTPEPKAEEKKKELPDCGGATSTGGSDGCVGPDDDGVGALTVYTKSEYTAAKNSTLTAYATIGSPTGAVGVPGITMKCVPAAETTVVPLSSATEDENGTYYQMELKVAVKDQPLTCTVGASQSVGGQVQQVNAAFAVKLEEGTGKKIDKSLAIFNIESVYTATKKSTFEPSFIIGSPTGASGMPDVTVQCVPAVEVTAHFGKTWKEGEMNWEAGYDYHAVWLELVMGEQPLTCTVTAKQSVGGVMQQADAVFAVKLAEEVNPNPPPPPPAAIKLEIKGPQSDVLMGTVGKVAQIAFTVTAGPGAMTPILECSPFIEATLQQAPEVIEGGMKYKLVYSTTPKAVNTFACTFTAKLGTEVSSKAFTLKVVESSPLQPIVITGVEPSYAVQANQLMTISGIKVAAEAGLENFAVSCQPQVATKYVPKGAFAGGMKEFSFDLQLTPTNQESKCRLMVWDKLKKQSAVEFLLKPAK